MKRKRHNPEQSPQSFGQAGSTLNQGQTVRRCLSGLEVSAPTSPPLRQSALRGMKIQRGQVGHQGALKKTKNPKTTRYKQTRKRQQQKKKKNKKKKRNTSALKRFVCHTTKRRHKKKKKKQKKRKIFKELCEELLSPETTPQSRVVLLSIYQRRACVLTGQNEHHQRRPARVVDLGSTTRSRGNPALHVAMCADSCVFVAISCLSAKF